jgi:hypothetical protein
MPNDEFPGVDVAVALILDDEKQKLLWTWNSHWRAFALPMSRVRPWHGVRGAHGPAAVREAAERAAAEALGVPVVVHHARRLTPILERSGRDGRLKSYSYEVFRAGPHDQFTKELHIHQPAIWLAGHEVLSGEFRPVAAASVKVIEQLVEAGLIPGRHQLASTILLSRGPDDAPEYLMRSNSEWGYFFPSKRRTDAELPLHAADRVVIDELGLQPGVTVSLRPASREPVTFHDRSESAEVPTFYVHTVFTAVLHDGARLTSREPLAWVPLADIVAGQSKAPKALSGTGTGPSGRVSRTARRILEVMGHF